MLKFDNAGGYGTDPVYARYGTPFLVNNPTRHGYVFDGWALLGDNGEIVQEHATLPATVPAESRNYRRALENGEHAVHRGVLAAECR